jgi:glycosyltransferase involved in cell wall biosynthesis
MPDLRNKDILSRIRGKIKSYLKRTKRINENFLVMSPITIPFYGFLITRQIYRLLLLLQLKHCLSRFNIGKPILWISIPTAQIIADIPKKLLVYHVHDRHIAQKGITKDTVKHLHDKLLQTADVVLYSSSKYYKESRKLIPNAFLLDHGVDYRHFSRSMDENLEVPKDIAGIEKPIIGYFGTGHENWELVQYLVVKRPQWNFVFIGQGKNVKRELTNMSNIFFLGRKEYSELPNYAKAFDVCILPFEVDEWVEYSNPIKIMEYLSTGKPVVSTSFSASEEYRDIVYCAKTRDEFLSLLEKAISEDTNEKQRKRIDAVKNETWDRRVGQLSIRLLSHLE